MNHRLSTSEQARTSPSASLPTLVCQVLDFDGTLIFDPTRPDGTPRKLMDVSRMENLGWRATTTLEEGIRLTISSAKPTD